MKQHLCTDSATKGAFLILTIVLQSYVPYVVQRNTHILSNTSPIYTLVPLYHSLILEVKLSIYFLLYLVIHTCLQAECNIFLTHIVCWSIEIFALYFIGNRTQNTHFSQFELGPFLSFRRIFFTQSSLQVIRQHISIDPQSNAWGVCTMLRWMILVLVI